MRNVSCAKSSLWDKLPAALQPREHERLKSPDDLRKSPAIARQTLGNQLCIIAFHKLPHFG